MHMVAQRCIDRALARSFLGVNWIPIYFSLVFITVRVGKMVLYIRHCFSFRLDYKLQLAAWALYYIYCRQNCKHNSNFVPKMVANLIEPKMWPLCKQGMAESMDGPSHPWMSRNGRRAIRGSMDGLDPPLAPNKALRSQALQLHSGR